MLRVGAYAKVAACLLIAVVGVISYLPAVDNSFISDDFVLLATLKNLDARPLSLIEMPSEIFRLMSYVYFWACFRIFGSMDAEPYYWAGIGLHVLVSWLVCAVVLTISGRWIAAWTAGIFFAGYERHQEAVMWISAANDTILTFNCLVFLLLWQRHLSRVKTNSGQWILPTALAAFALALFSKEGAVALTPLVFWGLILNGSSWREAIRKCLPLLLMTIAFGLVWISQVHGNFFVTKGFYALTPQFFPVYARSLFRLLSPALVFWGVLSLVIYQSSSDNRLSGVRLWLSDLKRNRSMLFFAALLALAIVPYSFLTYLNHIPSRNTYFPSVGLAGIVGTLFMSFNERMNSAWAKRASIALLLAAVSLNIAYIWSRKEPQFRARAVPTQQLIRMLNDPDWRVTHRGPVTICGFPLDPWIGTETVIGFTAVEPADVVFARTCDKSVADSLVWDESNQRYSKGTTAQALDGDH
jgi:hypothetical protein